MGEATIIIPHYKYRELTLACLQALAGATEIDHEVILVDNGTGHELPGRVIRNDKNRGFAIACNQGAAAAESPVLVFLNNDTEPRPGWLAPLLDALAEPGVAAAVPRLVNPDGTLQAADIEIVAHRNGHKEPMPRRDEIGRGPIRLGGGACFAITNDSFRQVRGFDERYVNGFEDVDLCFKLEAAGWQIMYEPASVVMHHGSASGPERFAANAANYQLLLRLWGDRMTPDRTTSWWFLARNSADYRLHRLTRGKLRGVDSAPK